MEDIVGDVTACLRRWVGGDREALAEAVPALYQQLRRLARAHLRGEGPGGAMQPTELVHELYIKMSSLSRAKIHDRAHFLAVAAIVMRRILVDHARHRRAQRRGEGRRDVTLDTNFLGPDGRTLDVLVVDQLLDMLESVDARQAQTVELRVFAGMSCEEIASVLGVSTSTVKNDWRFAKAWLSRALKSHSSRA